MDIFFGFEAWQALAAVGLLLAVGEIFVSGFVLLPMGVGCLLAAPFAYWVDSLIAQGLFLAFVQALVFVALRKWGPTGRSAAPQNNAQGMIGKECVVTASIAKHSPGQVKLHGDEWTAIPRAGETFEKGTWVQIVGLDGNKVVVAATTSKTPEGAK